MWVGVVWYVGLSQLCSIMLFFYAPIMLLKDTNYAPNRSNYAHEKVKFTSQIMLS